MCDLLADTGIAGRPDSFFRRQSIPWWAEHFKVSVAEWGDQHDFDHPYLAAALRQGCGGTAVFGLRLMWESVADLSNRLQAFYPDLENDQRRFQSAFGSSVYVHLSRQDKVAQAVSRVKAQQTGLWHVATDGTERERLKPGRAPVYDAQQLSEHVRALTDDDAAWTRWFAQQKIQPLCITYEMLSRDPHTALASVLSALDLDPSVATTVEPRTAKLADRQSRDWATRFRTEQQSPFA